MSTENLQKVALYSEIVSGIAVVVTLIFLGFEVRQNTQALELSTYDSLVADISNYYLVTATDSEVSEAMRLRSEGRTSDMDERQDYLDRRVVTSLWMTYDRAYLQWSSGTIDDRLFERFRRIMCRDYPEGFYSNAWPSIQRTTSPEFVQFIESCSGEYVR